MDTKQLKMVERPISTLKGYDKNPRKNDAVVARMVESIKEFGFRIPVVAKSDGSVIDGHLRLKAAQRIGMKSVPVVLADELTEAQVKAFRLLANRSANWADWDNDLLRQELAGLKDMDFDLSLTGFDADEISSMLDIPLDVGGLTDPDAVPEPPVVPVTKLGDVWLLGKHRLMCGDSTSIDAVEKLMEGRKAQMVHTDPPYGVEYQSNMRTKSAKFDVLKNDDSFLDIAPVIDACSDGWVFVWTSWKVLTKWLDQFESFGYPSNQIIWYKPGGGIGDLKRTFASDYETALVWHRGAELTGKRIGSVWKVSKDGATEYLHPTQKPVALAEEALDKTTKPGWIILDLFGGSGSTLIACEKTGRNARLMELDPKYCDVIVKRWENFTGKKAVLETKSAVDSVGHN